MRKATSTVAADPNEATCTIIVVDLETISTIARAQLQLLKSTYQGNHQRRRRTKEKENDETNS